VDEVRRDRVAGKGLPVDDEDVTSLASQKHRGRGPGAACADHDRVILFPGYVFLLPRAIEAFIRPRPSLCAPQGARQRTVTDRCHCGAEAHSSGLESGEIIGYERDRCRGRTLFAAEESELRPADER
jgi:hypothetical protein